ncbi:MAG: Calx-beta domain-containing protein, partial [Methylococcales bacterium]|nr:Calx-beta domain-containing protein [Methylococcales bacterium]
MTKSFFEASDSVLTVSDNNQVVYGAKNGTQTVKIKSGATNVNVDANVEKIAFDNALSSYKFQQAGTALKVFDATNQLIASLGVPDSASGLQLDFLNGTTQATISGDSTGVHIAIGGVQISNQTATALTTPISGIDSSITSTSGAFLISSSSLSAPTQEGKTITFSVMPNGAVDKATTLSIDFQGQALNSILAITTPDDFVAGNSITFNAGETAAKQITVTVKNDGFAEGLEAYKARLLDSSGAEKGYVVGTITDGVPILNVSANANTVNEGSSVIFSITSDVAAPVGGLVIPYQLGGSATNTADYSIAPATGTVTIPYGEKTGLLTFTTITDSVVESPETISLTLTPISNASINNATATTTIVDTNVVVEADKFFFSGAASVNEGETAHYAISHAAVTGTAITVPYTISGTATTGSDYTGASSGTLTFNVGDTVKTIDLPIVADGIVEAGESLTITLGNPSAGSIAAGQSTVSTTIFDTSATTTGSTTTLTTNNDLVAGSTNNDLIIGYINANGTNSTLNLGDTVDGSSGIDTLQLTIDGADAGSFPAGVIPTNIEIFSIKESGGVAGTYDFASISSETTVTNNLSGDDVTFNNLGSNTRLVIQGNGNNVTANTTFTMASTTDAVNLTLSNGVNGGNITRNQTGAASVTINSSGAENVVDTIDLDTANALNGLTINAVTNLTASLANDFAANSTVTINGSASKVDLSGAALSSAITNVNAASLTGGVLVKVNQNDKTADTAFTGGKGNDTLDIGKVQYSGTLKVDGDGGTDTLKLSDQAALSAATVGNILNFERIELYDDNDNSVESVDLSLLKNISTVQLDKDSLGDGYVLNNISASQARNIILAGNQVVSPTFNVQNALTLGNIDALGLTIDAGDTGNAVTVAGIEAPGIELINLNAIDSFTSTTLTGLPALTTFTIVGNGNVNLTTDKLQLNLNATIDASLSKGLLTVDASKATAPSGTQNGLAVKGSLTQTSVLTGSEFADFFTGGAGADSFVGAGGNDTLTGGTGADYLDGGAGSDVINGGAGADFIIGGAGFDTLNGGSGDDTFVYAATADLFDKFALVDRLSGGSGVNSLLLGTNAAAFAIGATDIWTGATNIDTLIGVANTTANTFVLDKSAETAGVKLVDLSANSSATGNKIDASSFTATNLTLIGSATGANILSSGAGNDTIIGGAAIDTIVAGNGADVIYTNGGNDSIDLSVTAAGSTVATADSAVDSIYIPALPTTTGSVSIKGFGTLDKLYLTKTAFGNITALTETTTTPAVSGNYAEVATFTATATAPAALGNSGAGIIAVGAAVTATTATVSLYLTSDMSAATTANSTLFVT